MVTANKSTRVSTDLRCLSCTVESFLLWTHFVETGATVDAEKDEEGEERTHAPHRTKRTLFVLRCKPRFCSAPSSRFSHRPCVRRGVVRVVSSGHDCVNPRCRT